MKTLYKLMLFFAIFHGTVLMVNSMNIFPAESTFYSDPIYDGDLTVPENLIKFIFPALRGDDGSDLEISINIIAGILTGGVFIIGVLISWISKSLAPIVIAVLGGSMIPMVMNSWKIFNKIFYEFDSAAMEYLALCFGVGIIVIAIITILEMPTHGRSGS